MSNWWNNNAEKRIEDFKRWTGDYNQITKTYCRKHVANKGYKSIIDCGCGIATEADGYKNDKYEIDYTGLDSCQYFININEKRGIKMINADLEKKFPLKENSYECVFVREVIEHLSSYQTTIEELIRIAQKEVLIAWFIKPDEREDYISYWEAEDLYHNRYNINKLEEFILSNSKVEKIFWKDINEKETVLHILMKK